MNKSKSKHQVGKSYFTAGLNMDCRVTCVRVKLVAILDKVQKDEKAGLYDCITEARGIRVYSNLASLKTRAF